MRQVVELLTRSLGQREAKKARYVHRSRKRAQPAGRIIRELILYRASRAVNCDPAWRTARRGLIRQEHDPEKWAPVFRKDHAKKRRHRGRSSMAERQLPKLHTRVRFPSPAPSLRQQFVGRV